MKRKKLLALIGGVLCLAMLATAILPGLVSVAAPSLEVLNPWGEIEPQENIPLAERPDTLAGGKIGILYFEALGGPEFADAVKAPLSLAFSGVAFEATALDPIYAFAQPNDWYEAKSEEYDAVVIALANDNISAYWSSFHAREFEKRGVPAVAVVTSTFIPTLAMAAEDHGITALRSIVVPIETFSQAHGKMSTGMASIANMMSSPLKSALTGALAAAEKAPGPIAPKDALQNYTLPENASYAKQLQLFNALATEEGFGDGLPLSIPTRAAVDEMLAATERAPDEVLGKLRMRYGICTIEKIAINAVMAGAEPEYFPVIVAAMEAFCDGIEDKSLFHAAMTTGENYMFMMILSGPLAKELDFATDRGYSTPGLRNNTTIGRAVMMAYRNIAHNTKPYVDINKDGRHQDHTGLVFTENEEQFPPGWITHGESMGFAKGQSSLTVVAVGRISVDDNWINNEPFSYLISELLLAPGQQMLRSKETLTGTNSILRLANLPTNPTPSKDLMILTLSPAHAALLMEEPETTTSTAPRDYGLAIPPGSGIGPTTPNTTATTYTALDPLGTNKSKQGLGSKEGIKEWWTTHGVKNNTTGANAATTGPNAWLTLQNAMNPDIPFAAHKNVVQPLLIGENPTYELIYQCKYYGTRIYRTQLITGATLTAAGADDTAPGTPKDFKALMAADGRVKLTWGAPDRTNGDVTYEVSCDDGVTWASVGKETTYVFLGLDEPETARFVVRALNGADNARFFDDDYELSSLGSGRGAQARAMATPAAPTYAVRFEGPTGGPAPSMYSISRNSVVHFGTIVNNNDPDTYVDVKWSVSDPTFATV
ncbi:MAG: fibronectin type III domain-containing protein, partial [Oscillospiraceae bacterium]|nr:fibronectin type III domain-containing protein [Oscillospiraceae bacterium]